MEALGEISAARSSRALAVKDTAVVPGLLLADYVRPLATTLVPLVDEYTAGITAYSQALVEYAEFCKRPDYTISGGTAFVAGFEPSVARVVAGSEHLLAAAAEARKVSTGRAVSAKEASRRSGAAVAIGRVRIGGNPAEQRLARGVGSTPDDAAGISEHRPRA